MATAIVQAGNSPINQLFDAVIDNNFQKLKMFLLNNQVQLDSTFSLTEEFIEENRVILDNHRSSVSIDHNLIRGQSITPFGLACATNSYNMVYCLYRIGYYSEDRSGPIEEYMASSCRNGYSRILQILINFHRERLNGIDSEFVIKQMIKPVFESGFTDVAEVIFKNFRVDEIPDFMFWRIIKNADHKMIDIVIEYAAKAIKIQVHTLIICARKDDASTLNKLYVHGKIDLTLLDIGRHNILSDTMYSEPEPKWERIICEAINFDSNNFLKAFIGILPSYFRQKKVHEDIFEKFYNDTVFQGDFNDKCFSVLLEEDLDLDYVRKGNTLLNKIANNGRENDFRRAIIKNGLERKYLI